MSYNPRLSSGPESYGVVVLREAQELAEQHHIGQLEGLASQERLMAVVQELGNMTARYSGVRVFVEAPEILFPQDGDMISSPGELAGEVLGFSWYSVVQEEVERGVTKTVPEEGVSMLVLVGESTGAAVDHSRWRGCLPTHVYQNFPSHGNVLAVPLTKGVEIQRLQYRPARFETVEDIELMAETDTTQYDHRVYVASIEQLLAGKSAFDPQLDQARVAAGQAELHDMNMQCPYLGRLVEVAADYMRAPQAQGLDRFNILKGRHVGVLRKFLYAPYYDNGNHRGAVQAVLYPRAVAEAVNAGHMSPIDADRRTDTLYVPLHLDHTLSAVE